MPFGGPFAAPRPRARPVAVVRLSLSDFRCYSRVRLDCDARPVVLVGPNGAGKTNLLEALSLLGPGRGLRRARLADLDRRQAGAAQAAGPWAVAATVETPAGSVRIGTGRDPGAGGSGTGRERRVVRLDGRKARGQSELAAHLSLVWLTPEMDRLFLDAAAARRRFLDRLVSAVDGAHVARVTAYEHAMRERARLLREGRADGAWLTALEHTMAAEGIAIAAARRALVARLDAAAGEAIGPFPRVGVRLEGTVEAWLDAAPALANEERLRAVLAARRRRDAETGGALGPHRSDLAVRHVAKDLPAAGCSTGEQKALLVSLVLAHARLVAAERGHAPVVLLDEVAARLDAGRRAALFDELMALGAQAWLAGTDEALFQPLAPHAQLFRVIDGTVTHRG
ncbi:MAG: DNA replication/repair protein RecF [Kiloniellales bacterium]